MTRSSRRAERVSKSSSGRKWIEFNPLCVGQEVGLTTPVCWIAAGLFLLAVSPLFPNGALTN